MYTDFSPGRTEEEARLLFGLRPEMAASLLNSDNIKKLFRKRENCILHIRSPVL